MLIGYQGDYGSNSERAAKAFAEKINNAELKPLINAQNVIDALKKSEIDLGVIAVFNSIGGEVLETKKALAGFDGEIVDSLSLVIHHSLFKKSSAVSNDKLKYVASHEQALKQTKKWRENNFKNLVEKKIDDTAIGAKWLDTGELDDEVAIICNRSTGEKYGLCLIAENIENSDNNVTKFLLIRKYL